MSPRFILLATLSGLLLPAFAMAEILPPGKVPLWQDQAPIGDGNHEAANAFITIYRPAKPNGAAVVICPGGGYGGLVTGSEGSGIAKWLNAHGIAGIVLEYRLPRGRARVPLLDAQRAIRMARGKAEAWGCDPKHVGIIGFSAGGHLAATAATHFDAGNAAAEDPIERMGCRPDFAMLVYPVITMGEKTHGGSKQNLLGPNPTPENVALFSNEKQVTDRTCPTFLAHALDDKVVPAGNSRMFYEALQAHQVPAQYLELPSGDHGLNGYKGPMWDAWQTESLLWLAAQKIIPQHDASGPDRASGAILFPSFKKLASGAPQVRLLPGQEGFVFSMYRVPGEWDTLRQLDGVMRDQRLGNGFDPGPGPNPNAKPVFDYLATVGWPVVLYSGGEMQIKGGRSVFGREHEAALTGMDRAGILWRLDRERSITHHE